MSHRYPARAITLHARRARPARRLAVESLEVREVPAVFTGAGPSLGIDLNNPNEVATFHTDGTTVFVHLDNGTATTAGTSVSGGGTANASFASATYSGTITITDSAAGTSVAFANSAGNYPQTFSITLDDPASG